MKAFPDPCLYEFFSSLQQVEYALKVWRPFSESPGIQIVTFINLIKLLQLYNNNNNNNNNNNTVLLFLVVSMFNYER